MYQSEPMQRCKLHQCQGACCLYGVWLDIGEAASIRGQAEIIIPHMLPEFRDVGTWFEGGEEADKFSDSGQVVHSSVLPNLRHYGGTACIFLTTGSRCALQLAGQTAGIHPWQLKPFYCILHPLDLDEQGRITLDETRLLLDEPGSCLRPTRKLIPLLKTFEEELRYLAGDDAYEQAVKNNGLADDA